DEERRDDAEQQEVLPPAAAERDPVRDGIAHDERERSRDPGVLERADEVAAIVADRVPVVAPGPGERVAEVDRPGLEGLVGEEAERQEEEDRQPRYPGREQQVRRQTAVTVEEAH